MIKHAWLLFGLFILLAGTMAGGFEQQDDKTTGTKPNRAGREPAKVTPEQEAEALRFVRQNHPQLAELLTQLKSSKPSQYQQAMRDLSKAATTLGDTQKRDRLKFELDLKAWQVNSQIQVLAARLAMSRSQEVEDELKAKLLEQFDLRLEQQMLERERTAARLEKLDAAIAKTKESRGQESQKAFERLTKKTVKPSPTKDTARPSTGPKN